MKLLIFSETTSTMLIADSQTYNELRLRNFKIDVKIEELKDPINMSFSRRIFMPLDKPVIGKVFSTATKQSLVSRFASEIAQRYEKTGKTTTIAELVRKARKMGISVGRAKLPC